MESSTQVRTSHGLKRLQDVQIGDTLYDEAGQAVVVLQRIVTSECDLNKITIMTPGSRRATIVCTPNTILPIRTAKTGVNISKAAARSEPKTMRVVRWAIKCDAADCACGFFAIKGQTFASVADADTFITSLPTIHPNLVHPYDRFDSTIGALMTCPHAVKIRKESLGLFAGKDPSIHQHAPAGSRAHPYIDPWVLGLWFGDGSKNGALFSAADQHTIAKLHRYAAFLSTIEPGYVAKVRLDRSPDYRADVVINGQHVTAKQDCFWIRITRGDKSRTNLFTTALRELGCFMDKSGGIPDIYMKASEHERMAFMARLLDSDGSLKVRDNLYELSQNGEDHEKLVFDFRIPAISCGFTCGEVSRRAAQISDKWVYTVTMCNGTERADFQAMLMPRKRIPVIVNRYDTDHRRIISCEAVKKGTSVTLCVSGGLYQLDIGVMAMGADMPVVCDDDADFTEDGHGPVSSDNEVGDPMSSDDEVGDQLLPSTGDDDGPIESDNGTHSAHDIDTDVAVDEGDYPHG